MSALHLVQPCAGKGLLTNPWQAELRYQSESSRFVLDVGLEQAGNKPAIAATGAL